MGCPFFPRDWCKKQNINIKSMLLSNHESNNKVKQHSNVTFSLKICSLLSSYVWRIFWKNGSNQQSFDLLIGSLQFENFERNDGSNRWVLTTAGGSWLKIIPAAASNGLSWPRFLWPSKTLIGSNTMARKRERQNGGTEWKTTTKTLKAKAIKKCNLKWLCVEKPPI